MLTNAAAKAAGAQSRAYKLHDQGGLHLLVRPTGTKSWQQKYRWKGREKLLTLGQFPDVTLNRARILQAEAKEKLDAGVDPSARVDIQVNTLRELAGAWYAHNHSAWSETHAADVLGCLERDVLPKLGDVPAGEISSPQLLEALRLIERRGSVATAQRTRQRLKEIFAYGKAEGLIASNPAEDLGAAMRSVPPSQPHAALVDIGQCRRLLADCEKAGAREATRLASRFLALTAVRLDAVRGARWDEIDLKQLTWTVPAARMKLTRAKKGEERFDHVVPLSEAAVAVLGAAKSLSRKSTNAVDSGALIFPGRNPAQPIGEGAIRQLYERAGYSGRHVPHGWRSSFSTILNEELGEEWRRDIDRALAHAPKDKVEAAYNRAQLLDRRRALFHRWGAMLAGRDLPTGETVDAVGRS